MIRLAIFDMDGTLTEEPSSWEYVHRRFHTDNHRNFRLYRNGFISYEEFFQSDVTAWLKMHPRLRKDDVMSILRGIRIRDGASTVINRLKDAGVITAVVSGGISWLCDILTEKMRIDYNISNVIATDEDGFIQPWGKIQVIPERKNLAVKSLQSALHISMDETISVGDSMENGMIHINSARSYIIGGKGRQGEIPLGNDIRRLLSLIW
ncbi:HAD-IB family phosphatase [Thermoplasma sp.]|uniref:HAD-IB family phosphatase n=1 Tax=Thermoplasma sp. TaxID=1973142 RepID=UPI0012864449|nr:HAD-IB family phosphatase [Thermoplasma sp.]KAA8923172.1 MAG: HAD-IB family phosphatase [Thermoplasma sp.]